MRNDALATEIFFFKYFISIDIYFVSSKGNVFYGSSFSELL